MSSRMRGLLEPRSASKTSTGREAKLFCTRIGYRNRFRRKRDIEQAPGKRAGPASIPIWVREMSELTALECELHVFNSEGRKGVWRECRTGAAER